MKMVSRENIHKTEAGGVSLGLQSLKEVEESYDEILGQVKKRAPHAIIEGVLVGWIEPPGIEIVVGATRDPQFGITVMFGLRGIFVELLSDVTFRLGPVDEADAQQMILGIVWYHLLQGYRGSPPPDENEVIRLRVAASKMISENETIAELDLNPIIVRGEKATVVDARVVLSNHITIEVERKNAPESILGFFKAKPVAVLGASAIPDRIGCQIVRNLSRHEHKAKCSCQSFSWFDSGPYIS
jgi:acyl-CoA synthetase (NDP forming)